MVTRGFTLIELLIVVAIIAILAAIAVPNFLEAQVRAKNSKCLADMRTMATALESYKLDTNAYPSDAGAGNGTAPRQIWRAYANPPKTVALPRANFSIGFELTTPISYITSAEILIDPYKTGKLAYYKDSTNIARSGREYYNFFNVPLRRWSNGGVNAFRWVENAGGSYVMWAAGPDGWANNLPGQGEYSEVNYIPRTIMYDATNGTVSNGDVYFSQKIPAGVLRGSILPAGY